MTKMPGTFKYKSRVWSLFGAVGALLGLYLFLVGATVYNTVEAEKAEQGIKGMTAELSQMEFSYLSSQAKITMDLAIEKGFVEPTSVVIAKTNGTESTAFVGKDKI